MQHYISSILDTGTNKTMIVFTDGSARSNPGQTGSGVIIKKHGWNSAPIKITKAVKYIGSSYEGELEAIKIATEYVRDNISQSAMLAVTSQNRENYHNSTIRAIHENLVDVSPKVQNIRLVYCPAHQCIAKNEQADSLAKTASRKAKHLQHNTQLSPSEIQQGNKMLSISKWTRRWENSKQKKYKAIVPSISHKKLTLKATLFKNTSRKGISKTARLKTGHSMLEGHKSKIDIEISLECSTCKVKETPEHLNCKEYDTEWAQLEKDVKEIFYKNNYHKMNITIDDILGECDLPSQDAVIVRKKVEEFILATGKEIWNGKNKNKTKFFLLKFFVHLFLFLSLFCLNILVYILGVYTNCPTRIVYVHC